MVKQAGLVLQLYIFKYDNDEWENVLVKDPAWTREETDYLLELCELFDLRFLIIADRYAVRHYPSWRTSV